MLVNLDIHLFQPDFASLRLAALFSTLLKSDSTIIIHSLFVRPHINISLVHLALLIS